MYSVEQKNNNIYIKSIENFDLSQTLDCGQAFRWSTENGVLWRGTAFGKYLELYRDGDSIVLLNTSMQDFEQVWRNYFDIDRDYKKIITAISCDDVLKSAGDYGSGIRILNQEPWEALCSFIISQNNNIPRIKGIIDRLCEGFGEYNGSSYSFPTAERLAALTVDDLAPLRSGFRAKYILDAARKVSSGEVCLKELRTVPVDSAREQLMKISGVGPKVADCALLFSLGHIEAFPRDVWIKRAMTVLFDGELPSPAVPYAGIVQQYIFYYARSTKLDI